jgi:hypothetical protein
VVLAEHAMTATAVPHISDEILRALSQAEGVCVRPLLNRVTDTATGEVRVVPIRCGSTRAVVCQPCADRNQRLRMQQCREGWHLDTEPEAGQNEPVPHEMVELEGGDDADHVDPGRRVRSTRRRQDVPDLPCVPVAARTIGRVFESGDWSPVSAVDVRHVHAAVLRQGGCGWDAGGPGPV